MERWAKRIWEFTTPAARAYTEQTRLARANTLAPNEALDFARLPYRLRVLVWLSGGRIRWQTIAIMLGADYIDAFRACDPASSGYTFPTWDPHVRLDYAFVPKTYAERLASCQVVAEGTDVTRASDHFPLRIEFHCWVDWPTHPSGGSSTTTMRVRRRYPPFGFASRFARYRT